MKVPRTVPHALSPAERRVLDAFSCGRLPAGKLSAALAVARRAPVSQPAPAARVPQAAPARVKVGVAA